VDAAIARIEAANPQPDAVTRTRFDQARRESGADPPDGPFRGVPILFKDLGCTVAGTLARDALTEFANLQPCPHRSRTWLAPTTMLLR
jgi:Asp-tRNA(Asn)/Glu-tRNA(Gln) amidotransferase A subunit family amidase